MTDMLGALTLPIPLPDAGDAEANAKIPPVVADPFLRYALSFFQAVINHYGTAAWAQVARGTAGPLPIKTIQAYDPIDLAFVETQLPCLYMWREEGLETDRMAEDILAFRSRVHVLWVMPPVEDGKQKLRMPFINGVVKMLAWALEMGRDPAWVVPNDPDPQAATRGSVFVRWVGITGYSSSPRWKRKVFVVNNEEAHEHFSFFSVETTLEIEEILEEDISKYPLLQGVDVTQATDADPDGTITGVVTEHALLT